MSALDKALLREGLSAPVTIAALVSLSPAQLALASLRPDLDFLTRQRAYVEFLVRRSAYRKSLKRNSHEQPLLERSLDFECPASPSDLPTPDLLLLQFNPRCISAREVEAAQQLFVERAHAQQADDEAEQKPAASQGLHVERCDLQYRGGVPSFATDLSLEVEDGALVLSRPGKVMVKVQSQHVSSFQYLTTVFNKASEGDMDCVLNVVATSASLAGDCLASDVQLKIHLERVGVSDSRFDKLRSAVTKWSAVHAFSVNLVETRIAHEQHAALLPYPTPPARAMSLPDPTRSSSPAPSRSTTATSLVPSSTKRSASDELQQQENKRLRTAESVERDEAEGLSRFVWDVPEHSSWHPGYLVRQIALLRAISPSEPMPFPDFSPDELALLSRSNVTEALPDLPSNAPTLDPLIKHRAFERLALERIYRNKPRLEVDTTRLVLLTDSFPDLREYARKVAKVRRAIEDVKQAYATVVVDLEQRIARQTHDTQDPLESLLYLVRMMKDSLHFCCGHFYHNGALIRTVPPSLTALILGSGPLRRFEAALKGIVLYEEMAGAIG